MNLKVCVIDDNKDQLEEISNFFDFLAFKEESKKVSNDDQLNENSANQDKMSRILEKWGKIKKEKGIDSQTYKIINYNDNKNDIDKIIDSVINEGKKSRDLIILFLIDMVLTADEKENYKSKPRNQFRAKKAKSIIETVLNRKSEGAFGIIVHSRYFYNNMNEAGTEYIISEWLDMSSQKIIENKLGIVRSELYSGSSYERELVINEIVYVINNLEKTIDE